MSVLVVGISHNTAPLGLLEQVALGADAVPKLVHEVLSSDHVTEATVISTCNRVEIYAEVDRFHGSVEEISALLLKGAGEATETLLPHLYVHYDDGAVSHLLQVTAGLDSMAVGEGQILGQTRQALRVGQELGSVGPALNVLFQQALRVGKRAHAETGIDKVAPSLVSAALDRCVEHVGSVAGLRVAVLGAGSMAGLAVATVTRLGAGRVDVVNRTPQRAARLAAEYDAHAVPLDALAAEIAEADVLVACAGATAVLVSRDMVAEAMVGRTRPLAIVDVALPHDVDPAVAEIDGVRLIDLRELSDALAETPAGREVLEVRRIVAEEIASFLTARRQAQVTPTVVALRSMATAVVDAELSRLDARLPGLDEHARAEIRRAVNRVADKLLHEPTVRVRELANEEGAVSYAAALAELFALDPQAVSAVTRPTVKDEP